MQKYVEYIHYKYKLVYEYIGLMCIVKFVKFVHRHVHLISNVRLV